MSGAIDSPYSHSHSHSSLRPLHHPQTTDLTLPHPPSQSNGGHAAPVEPEDTPLTLPEGRYRVLLRAHRYRGGPLDEMSEYDSYLSRVFEYRKKPEKPGEGKGEGKGE